MHSDPSRSLSLRSRGQRLAFACAVALPGPALVAQGWLLNAATGPSARQLPRMVYDLGRNQVVLFGGFSRAAGAANAETWLFDGTAWTQATPATVPPARDTHAMSYDLARGVVVMFGGVDSGNFPASINNETWEWNGTDWTQRTPTASPGPRFSMAMAFDSARNVHVMFGGSSSTARLAETWEYDGVTWTQANPATTPPARGNHGMVYDATRNRIVMFGGRGAALLGDTWEHDGVDWQQVSAAVAPSPRTGFGMAFDLLRGATVLQGGLTNAPNNETWEYLGGQWYRYRLVPSPAGTGRTNQAMTFVLANTNVVMFGGAGSADLADTWEFGGAVASAATYGLGCAGSNGTPTLDVATLPAIGSSFDLQLANVPPGGFTLLVAGGGGATSLPVPGTACTQFVQQPFAPVGALAPGGTATFSIAIPSNPSLQGLAVHFQGVALDAVNALGVTTSNGVRAVVN